MSGNPPDNGWQLATGRKRKASSNPATEASAPQSRTPGVEQAENSPIVSAPGPAASQTSNKPLQQTSLPIIISSAELSRASYLNIPEQPSPEKSEKSSVSSSLEKGYLTAPQSPGEQKSSVSSSPEKGYLTAPQSPEQRSIIGDVPGNGGFSGTSDTEDAYVFATEQPEEALSNIEHPQTSSDEGPDHQQLQSSLGRDNQGKRKEPQTEGDNSGEGFKESDVDHPQASSEEVSGHQQTQSSSGRDNQGKGKERETYGDSPAEGIREPVSSTSESLLRSPDFRSEFLTFPAPEIEGEKVSPKENVTKETKGKSKDTVESAIPPQATPLHITPWSQNQTDDKEKEKIWWLEQNAKDSPDESENAMTTRMKMENRFERRLKEERESKAAKAASTVGDKGMLPRSSVLVPNRPRVVEGEPGAENWTKRAMMLLPIGNQQLTSYIDSAHPRTMAPRRSSASLSAEAADFVPMPTIAEGSTSTTPEPVERAARSLPSTLPGMAPELSAFAGYNEETIRAMEQSRQANSASVSLAAPGLRRPLAPSSSALPRPSSPPPSGVSPLGVYDNETPGVPSHWIPLYGSVHGMFWDPLTKLFMGDGAPRPTLHRADGTTPCGPDTAAEADRAAFPVGNPEDVMHVQRSTLTAPHQDRPYAPANDRFFCWCTERWLPSPHNCPPDTSRIPAGAGAPIRPDTVLPDGWVTHTAPINDTSYLERMGLSAHYDAQLQSAVEQAWAERGGETAAGRGGPDTPIRSSRPMTSADLAAAGFPMPTRRPTQVAPSPAPVTTEEGTTTGDSAARVPGSRQEKRAAQQAAAKVAKAAKRGGGRGGQGSSRGGRGGGGAAGARIAGA